MATTHDFSRLNCLVVDDFASFCDALRNMLQSFGVASIDVVHNGDDALIKLEKTRYDLVLCDYNLGDGRNGNDILEEAKFRKLLKSANLFLMITAENTSDMVRGALEYQPDDYLTKPFTKEVLQTRLQRLLDRNKTFSRIYACRDRGQYDQAIEGCQAIAAERGRYSGYALKLQAEILVEAGLYKQATDLYQEVLMVKNLAWARLGLGKSFYFQEMYEKAVKSFNMLVDADKGYVQAWDWLARAQEAMGDMVGCQASLEAAVKVSPINVRRQGRLGEVALANGDTDRAETAYSRAVKIGKHSVYREPDNYFRLSSLLAEKLENTEGLNRKNAEMKASSAMDELRTLYKGDHEIQLRSRLMDHKVFNIQGKTGEADNALFKAYDLCQKVGTGRLSGELKEQLLARLEEKGRTDLAEVIVQQMQQEESSHNRQAVEYYDQGDIKAALKVLQLAIREKPRSFAVNLNMAQVTMHHIIKFGMDAELLDAAGEALERVSSISDDDHRRKLLTNLEVRYQKLRQRSGEDNHEPD